MPDHQIRQAKTSDLKAIADIHVNSFLTAYRGIVPESFLASLNINDRIRGWHSTLNKYPMNLTVAEASDGKIQGFCCAGPVIDVERNSPFEFEVYGLHVRPAHQRVGIGTQLLKQAFIRALRTESLNSAIVWTFPELKGAKNFYEHHGGRLVKNGTWQLGKSSIPEVGYGWRKLNRVARFV